METPMTNYNCKQIHRERKSLVYYTWTESDVKEKLLEEYKRGACLSLDKVTEANIYIDSRETNRNMYNMQVVIWHIADSKN